jgi:hypothetical protein
MVMGEEPAARPGEKKARQKIGDGFESEHGVPSFMPNQIPRHTITKRLNPIKTLLPREFSKIFCG